MKRVALLLLIALGSSGALSQSPNSGMLLVATPQLSDPRFAETVILILNHSREGALGVIVNRPTWVEPEELFPDMGFFRRYRGPVYFGGPVARTSALFLIRDESLGNAEQIVDGVYVTANPDEVSENLRAGVDDRVLRVYAGYAGWGPGQLDGEISTGDWQLAPASADRIFTREPTQLWREVHRVEPDLSIVALPEFHRQGRCASRNALNSLVSLHEGQSSPLANCAPILYMNVRSSTAPDISQSGFTSSVTLW